MRLLVYDMSINVNGIYYVHVCEQARWARSVGNSTIENTYVCIIIIIIKCLGTRMISNLIMGPQHEELKKKKKQEILCG